LQALAMTRARRCVKAGGSGGIYTVLDVTNTSHPSDKFVPTVSYIGAHGQRWSRPLVEFQDKFNLVFYGTNLAPI
jgi:hypothetical protein